MQQTIQMGELSIHRLGLGTNRITDTPQARELLKHAIEIGIQFIDTADIYTYGASETTIGDTLAPYPKNIIIATKGGMTRDDRKVDGSPAHLRVTVDTSLQRLKLSQIYLYQLHRVDPKVPLAESINALKQLQSEGKIKHIGLSEVSIAEIEAAQKIAPIISVQNEYNLFERKHDAVVDYCTANKIVFIPWFPLSRGNLNRHSLLTEIAKKYQINLAQLALTWLLKRSPVILPIPGTLDLKHLQENYATLSITLKNEDFLALDNLEKSS